MGDPLLAVLAAGMGMGGFLGWKVHQNFGTRIEAVVKRYQEASRKRREDHQARPKPVSADSAARVEEMPP